MQKMTSKKATGPSEVSVETIAASGKIRVKVIMDLCQCELDGLEMPNKRNTSVVVPIFKRKYIVMKYGSYRGVHLQESGTRNVERKLEENTNTDQFEWIAIWNYARKKSSGAIFLLRRMQEEY